MGKTVAVSFEGDSVKIVHASLRGKGLTVNKAESIPESDFDNYLRREKAREFIVTGEFRESYHDVITTPVVKDQYLKKVVEAEIRKVLVQKEFSFVYSPVGEKVIDNRKAQEVFYYAVPKDTVRDIVNRFHDNGKTVKALYSAVFSAAALIDKGVHGEAHLGIFSAGKARAAFFKKEGKIYFLRNYESYEAQLSDFDIQNINMTISFCFQSLRLNPASVFIMGPMSESLQLNSMSTAPLACLVRPEHIKCSREMFSGFTLPIASFLTSGASDILGMEFGGIYRLKKFMAYASMVFIALTLICAGAISYELKNVADKRERIRQAKDSGSDVERIFADYASRQERISRYMPAVEFLNRPSPDLRGLLISLGGSDFRELTLNGIEVSYSEGKSTVSLRGVSGADTYSALQDSLDNMEKELAKIGNMKITDRAVELKDKTFSIELGPKTE
ncbi:MAG: hypothetical protein HZA16_05345 [Nitrospirae bacterium]|nr:hypothetical protein [Nitrospirota bacterium]